ncbi:GIY-YIG nuclease family protein [Cupriavidus gilardii]|uniref:GIY-YIG nuclease family protein n=1 Tax=Cupriavidus gilardii TaxID=82541 RepID=UPI0030B86109
MKTPQILKVWGVLLCGGLVWSNIGSTFPLPASASQCRFRDRALHSPPKVTTPSDHCWYLYLLECADGSLYTGITTDVGRRFAQHQAGTGARYTRSRKPIAIAAQLRCADRAEASRLEALVKRLHVTRKRAFCAMLELDHAEMPDLLAWLRDGGRPSLPAASPGKP